MTLRPALITLATLPLLLLGTACSGSVSIGSDPKVSASDVESQVEKAFTDQGATNVTVDCPSSLKGVKGATLDCDESSDTGLARATVTVTSVDGTDVKFDIDSVPVLTAEDAASKASEQLAAQVGEAAPDVTCPDDLVGEVGTTMVCTLTAGADTYDTTLTVTDDGGGSIGFDISVASAPN